MTLPTLNKATFVQVHSEGSSERLQVFGGRVQLADSSSPTAWDWMVLPEGSVIEVTAAKWARMVDDGAYVQVSAV
jgi:hypothetical protein